MLTVTTPATDYTLLTIQEMRAAAGIIGATQDPDLNAHEAKVADSIAAYCNLAIAGSSRPTLKQETLTETFRLVRAPVLILSRRHAIEVISVTVDGALIDASEYEVQPESGLLYRLSDDRPIDWCATKVTVVYKAGFSTVPADLKMAATNFFRTSWLEKSRDPAVKSEEIDIPGVMNSRQDFWVGALPGQPEGPVPDTVAGQLVRFRNVAL